MCGIIGYTGTKEVKNILLKALETLEYRGYDSAGIAMSSHGENQSTIYKCTGKVKDLMIHCEHDSSNSQCGIGHTRWATHGGVTNANAHPHHVGRVTMIHNGIIENYLELMEQYGLQDQLQSETDSEVVAALLNYYYKGNPKETIRTVIKLLKGTFSFAILFEDQKDMIYGIRNVSPIVATVTDHGTLMASDITALYEYSQRYFVLPEYHILELSKESAKLYTLDNKEVEPSYLKVDWDVSASGKQGYPFYMEKEIMEQPKAIESTLKNRIVDGLPNFQMDGIVDEVLKSCTQITMVACGTAMHAGLVGKNYIQSTLGIPVNVEMASEFTYSQPVIHDHTLVIALSQSGETIDTLEAIRYAKSLGATVISILNVKGSSIARESDYNFFTNAGPEISVASTKAYTTQVTALYLLGCRMALLRGKYTEKDAKSFIEELQKVPQTITKVLQEKDSIHRMSSQVLMAKDLFMIGRGLDYYILLEASLKLKEISYIHSEAYSSGELKHGTIALITKGTPVVAVVTQKHVVSKELSNIKETQSRGASIFMFVSEDIEVNDNQWDVIYRLPVLRDEFMVFPAAVAMQLFAYYVSLDKGLDVDKPRNLAKVVTVE